MQTLQSAAFNAAEVDRDQEIELGNTIQRWRNALADGCSNPRLEREARIAASRLAEVNQRYLPSILRKYFGVASVQNDELWTSGFLGLVQAAQSYDPTKGYFWHYSKLFVLGEIQDLLRKNQLIILPKAKFAEAQRNPELRAMLSYTPIEDNRFSDDCDDSEDTEAERLEWALQQISDDSRSLIERFYGLGCEKATQTAIAAEAGVSGTTISKRRHAALAELQAILGIETEQTPENETTEPYQAESTENQDSLDVSFIGAEMQCPECLTEVPTPPEGDKVVCPECSVCLVCEDGELQPDQSTDEPTYKDAQFIPEWSPEQRGAHERSRALTQNSLASIYAQLQQRGTRYEPVCAAVLNLWRETRDYYLFDGAAMDRVEVWIEEVENPADPDSLLRPY